MSEKPLVIDLFCGLGGWSEGFMAEGYECRGYDIEAHDYGTGGYPGELVLRDVRSITGAECKDAAVIVASPPCQAYSYRAMPWKRAKALPPPDNTLFNECFRIQREASEAAGRYIPLIVENVRGAQKWVGRARWNYGSFYLWGDVPALMPMTLGVRTSKTPPGNGAGAPLWKDRPQNSLSHATLRGTNKGWYGISDGRKVSMNFHEHEKTGKPGRRFQGAAVEEMGVKMPSEEGRRTDVGKGARFTSRDCGIEGVKQGGDWFGKDCESSMSRLYGSKSPKRKMASAMIAKIPLPLSLHIARTFKPKGIEKVQVA